MTNQYEQISITNNKSSATANSTYSNLTLPPPNRVKSVPANPRIIPIEPVMSTVFIIALYFLLVLRIPIGAQPHRDVGGLHVSLTTLSKSLFSASASVSFLSLVEKLSRVFLASYFLR